VIRSFNDSITGRKALLGEAAGSEQEEIEEHACAAPTRAADLSSLPLTYIDVSQVSILYLEESKYAMRSAGAGVSVEFRLYLCLPRCL